jgi:predicted RNA-binding Zn ribbon-like protein
MLYFDYNAYYIARYVRSQAMFNAYNKQLSDFVQDLINSYDPFLEEPEHLQTQADVDEFLSTRGIQPKGNVSLDALRALRDEMRAIWTAPDAEAMLEKLNPLLAEGQLSLQLSEDLDWRFSLEDIKLAAALGIALTLQEHGHECLRACASSPCQDVFVDTSRNKTRRFCSERCANRYNVAAFRDRQR